MNALQIAAAFRIRAIYERGEYIYQSAQITEEQVTKLVADGELKWANPLNPRYSEWAEADDKEAGQDVLYVHTPDYEDDGEGFTCMIYLNRKAFAL